MFRRGIRSALFIDYENVAHRKLPETIPKWLAWLEDGEFDDEKRRRRFIVKRIYWNTTAEPHRTKFERAGFTAVLCEKFAGLKNGADIRMALDVQETLFGKASITEYILISRDSDFVPVLQRLAQSSKRTAILVSFDKPQVHATFSHFADVVIQDRKFMAATEYVRPTPTVKAWFQRMKGSLKREVTAPPARDLLALATDHVIRVTSLRPNEYTSRADIERELKKIREFSTNGRMAYFGYGSYRALMLEIAKKSDRIQVTPASGMGVNVKYVPKDEDD